MMKFVSNVFELALFQKIQKESKDGLAVEQPFEVTTTFAQEDIHHKAVILRFRLLSGLPVSFAIQPNEAEIFYKQLGEAIEKRKRKIPKFDQ
jgi:hypothetical protein